MIQPRTKAGRQLVDEIVELDGREDWREAWIESVIAIEEEAQSLAAPSSENPA
jgi:hypothetical protein